MTNKQSGGQTTHRSTEPADELDVCTAPVASSTSSSMYRRILLIVAIVVCLVLGVYFKYFHRLPTEDILAVNLAKQTAASGDYYDGTADDAVTNDAAKRSQYKWDQWIVRNSFVSIGELFDKCGKINSVGQVWGGLNPPPPVHVYRLSFLMRYRYSCVRLSVCRL